MKFFKLLNMALLTSVGFSTHSANAQAAPLELVLIDRQVVPSIVISPQSSAAEKFAAKELATYLQKISGREVAIEASAQVPPGSPQKPLIVVGTHPLNSALASRLSTMEETIIEVTPNTLHLVGGKSETIAQPDGTQNTQDRGALYAVYNLLDELGVRWYRPDEWGEHVPKSATVKVPLGRRQFKPAYPWRQSFVGYRHRSEQTPEQAQIVVPWSVRNRQNTNIPNMREELGGARWVITWHNVSSFFPASTFEANPEYRALVNGERRKDGQLCLGNPEVQRIAAESAVAYAKNNPNYITFSLEPEDNALWCQCDLCKAMDDPKQKLPKSDFQLEDTVAMGDIVMSNRVNLFGKIVAEKVAQTDSKIKMLWLAYNLHTEVPTRVTSLPDNVVIMPAAFSSAFDPLLDNAYSDYSRNLFDPTSKPNQNYLRVLKGYGKMTRIVTYEYWSGLAWAGPMPIVRTMQDRLKSYRQFPIDGVYTEVYPHWGPQTINFYFMNRLLWNPDLDVEKELDLYCKNYYGPAYKPMLEYHKLLEDAAHAGIPHYSYGINTHAIFTPPVVKRMGELIGEAKQLIGEQEPYKKRFEGVWAGYEYTRLVLPYFEELKNGNKLEAAKHWERANKLILSYKDGDVFDNGVLFSSLQFFGNYNLNIPAEIQQQAKELVAKE